MLLEKLNLHKRGDQREFEDFKEKLESFTLYKKRLKRDIRKLRSGRKDFYFFHRFEFGSKRETCFLFGDVEEMPWTTMIGGGTLAFPEMEEERYKGWDRDYKSAAGYCKRLKTGKNQHTIFIKVTDGRSTLRSYYTELQDLFDEVFGKAKLKLDIINLDEDNELHDGGEEDTFFERLDAELSELERVDETDLIEQFEQARDVFRLIEEWSAENPAGKRKKPKEYERIRELEEQLTEVVERVSALSSSPIGARRRMHLILKNLFNDYQKAFGL